MRAHVSRLQKRQDEADSTAVQPLVQHHQQFYLELGISPDHKKKLAARLEGIPDMNLARMQEGSPGDLKPGITNLAHVEEDNPGNLKLGIPDSKFARWEDSPGSCHFDTKLADYRELR